jgi:hypothetical protein
VLENPVPQGFIGNRDVTNMIAEIRALAERGYFQDRAGRGPEAIAVCDGATLAKFRSTVDVDDAVSAEMFGVSAAVTTWTPGQLCLFQACLVSIRDKTEKTATYALQPDWLVIQVVAPPDVFAYDLADQEMKTLGPFKKVFVLYPFADGHLYVATWAAGNGGTIAADIPILPLIEMPYDEALHEWAASVEQALEPRRMRAWFTAESDSDVPKMTSSPLGVQWYRKWLGQNPWVTCKTHGDRIRAYFWTAGDWAGGRVEELDANDIAGAADRIWNFISPNTDTVS